MRSSNAGACVVLFAILLLSVNVAAGAGQNAEKYFESGTQAFDRGDFAKALDLFQAAQKAGLKSAALDYNQGVTLFKLKRYDEAQRQFKQLTTDADTAALAYYNLGRIAVIKRDPSKARHYFQITSRTAKDEKLRSLAEERLRELPPPRKARRWSGFVSLAGGHDDNVALIADSEVLLGHVEDNFLEFAGFAAGQLTGSRRNGLRLKATGYYQDYQDANEFDFGDLRLTPELDRSFGQWDWSLAGFIDLSYLDKAPFERIVGTELASSRNIYKQLDLRLKYQLSLIDAGSPYDDLTGRRHRFTAGLGWLLSRTYSSLDYTLELNDRDDADFPTRHTIAFAADRDFSDVWSAGVTASYRLSEYQQTDRSDKRLWLGLYVSRRIPWDFRLFGKYDYMRNDSNQDVNDYTSNVFSIGLERFF